MEGNPYILASDGLLARKSGEWAKRKHHYLRNYCGITTEFGRLAVEHFCNSLQKEGFINTRHVSVPEANPLYRFTLFSRHPRGEDFWLKILKTDKEGQRELL